MTSRPKQPGSFIDVARARRMVRSFRPDPVDPGLVDALIDLARRAPAAGNTDGREFLVLEGPEQTSRYWDVTLDPARRENFRWPGLFAAPVLIVVLVRPGAWVDRYREPDKTATGLGEGPEAWPVPFWWVDAGMAVMTLLHGAVAHGLGALFFGLFAHEPAVLEHFDVPAGWRAAGTVALGRPGEDAPVGPSAQRPRRPLSEVVHRGGWA